MKRLIFVPILVFILFGCVKDELTKPAEVKMVFSMNMDNENDYLQFNEGTFVVSQISFDGSREAGEDYSFVAEFNKPVKAYLHTLSSSDPVAFDVPQGIYQDIDMELNIGNDEESISFKGTYTNVSGRRIPVIFRYDLKDKIVIRGQSREKDDIIISKDKPNIAEIKINQEKIFQIVSSTRMLESAKLIDREGIPTIVISKMHNEHIFNVVVSRIERFTSALFD